MDFEIYEQLNGWTTRHGALADVFGFFAADGQILFLALLAALFFARGKWRSVNGRHGVAAAGFSALLALGAAQVIGTLWDRARPYEAHPGQAHLLGLAPSPDPSFPSDHATAAYAIGVAIGLRHTQAGVVALILATLVAVSRVALGTHYPTDVLAGAALGALAALLLWAPPVRRRLHRLADRAGELYDRLITSLPDRRRASAFSRRQQTDEQREQDDWRGTEGRPSGTPAGDRCCVAHGKRQSPASGARDIGSPSVRRPLASIQKPFRRHCRLQWEGERRSLITVVRPRRARMLRGRSSFGS